ncbi:leucine/isoleucine/valine transporter permease subunit [Thalassovita gelatinovora]|uniref:Leucine/isoleucine/valine transporter permease subunit n=1 Tax=Thalassovita gelatinovora TaxID=53501 RepID=A0A0P1FI10_THAGE|nr:branched-chain amino acid ABC transporter permease [Thalassovita gelatinovora]QIZ82066.1 branched-chain amino acid ABC transporter permease [Thalassovita gelatinovora]CUH67579.1 leucine/isoleucine/valine transporter permease subunit [Thalassovita gelatinovora]SEP71435.1 amino acid/amide ABC transporter membrane protein 2, HAAT family [Thalassovita gelatinovora]
MKVIFKTSYDNDIDLHEDWWARGKLIALVAVMAVLPFVVGEYYLAEATNTLIWSLAGMGLMLLVGHTGQASLGHAAFMAIGAYTDAALMNIGVPWMVAFPLAALAAGLFGALVAIPAVRMSGIYLAIATLALFVIVEEMIIIMEPITGGVGGIFAPSITIAGVDFDRYTSLNNFYWLCLGVVVLVTWLYANLLRSPTGRSFLAVRDSEVSARALGINVTRTRSLAFGLSCAMTGLAGALMGHYISFFNYELFSVFISINLLLVVTIGGLGFIQGAFFGAILITAVPQLISILRDGLNSTTGIDLGSVPGLDTLIFSCILIGFIIYEPAGLYGRWLKMRAWVQLFPLARRDMFRRQKTYIKTERMR